MSGSRPIASGRGDGRPRGTSASRLLRARRLPSATGSRSGKLWSSSSSSKLPRVQRARSPQR
eukprot:4874706-Pyramimonas_sp.AAC.1